MANSPQSFHQTPMDFRAPPPSPVAAGRRSSVANDEFLTEFLHRSLRVPDLVLPDRVFPRQNSKIQNLPKLDFESLNLNPNEDFSDAIEVIGQTGCFELVNHGISGELLSSAANAGAGVFRLSPEKKSGISRSAERSYGFVEFHGDEKELNEEFVWCRDESLKSAMEEIWPDQFLNFSAKMETLMTEIETISKTLFKVFLNPFAQKRRFNNHESADKEATGSVCYIYKHGPNELTDTVTDSLRYDVIRMLIRGSEHSHTLGFHVCDGSSEFHVYSKKGWVSFSPSNSALIITIGDQLQKWSEGKYKHVIGRPIFRREPLDSISMAFLYSPPPHIPKGQKYIISFDTQILLVLIIIFLYNLLSYAST